MESSRNLAAPVTSPSADPNDLNYVKTTGPRGTTTYSKSGQKKKRAFMRRTKTGCVTCRRRKKRCDEARPTCQACSHSGYECEGYSIERPATSGRDTEPTGALPSRQSATDQVTKRMDTDVSLTPDHQSCYLGDRSVRSRPEVSATSSSVAGRLAYGKEQEHRTLSATSCAQDGWSQVVSIPQPAQHALTAYRASPARQQSLQSTSQPAAVTPSPIRRDCILPPIPQCPPPIQHDAGKHQLLDRSVPSISIGNDATIGEGCRLSGSGGIAIGRNTWIGPRVTIAASDREGSGGVWVGWNKSRATGKIQIGENVHIEGECILQA